MRLMEWWYLTLRFFVGSLERYKSWTSTSAVEKLGRCSDRAMLLMRGQRPKERWEINQGFRNQHQATMMPQLGEEVWVEIIFAEKGLRLHKCFMSIIRLMIRVLQIYFWRWHTWHVWCYLSKSLDNSMGFWAVFCPPAFCVKMGSAPQGHFKIVFFVEQHVHSLNVSFTPSLLSNLIEAWLSMVLCQSASACPHRCANFIWIGRTEADGAAVYAC